MGSREAIRLREAARARIMDVKKDDCKKESVLMNTEDIAAAAKKATHGGKTSFVGLYTPHGRKIESKGDDDTALPTQKSVTAPKGLGSLSAARGSSNGKTMSAAAQLALEEAKQKKSLGRISRKFDEHQEKRMRKAEKNQMTVDELDDAESQAKADKILAGMKVSDKEKYNELFDFFDVDKDRTWGSIEFAQRMTDIGCPTSVEEAANLLYFAGVRDVDRITYNDFVLMMPKLDAYRRLLEKDAMRVFAKRDKNNGFVSIKALRDVIHELAGPDGIDKHHVDDIVRKADRERTGWVTFDFFIRALLGSPAKLEYKKGSGQGSLLQRLMRCCGVMPKEEGTRSHWDEDE